MTAMKLRTIGLAAISFALGATALHEVEAKTTWLDHFGPRLEYKVADTREMPWVRGHDGDIVFDMKFLHRNPVNNDVVMLLRYPAGQVNANHVHSHGHGMYVLEGKLVTHRGTYEPGSFVWFPPHEVITHGASKDEDVVVLFIRNADMDIQHVNAPAH